MPTRSLSNGGIRKILRMDAQGMHVDSFTRVDDSSGNPNMFWGSPQHDYCIDFCVWLSILFGIDDLELTAQVHHRHHIQQAVVITILTRWNLRVPQLLDEIPGFGRCRRQRRNRIHGY